ncbi:MAG: hypothetical protein IJP48_05025 [Synergistaceae bacterium]|nr:hypothetical protein [Synergistaceae bacterium]
MRLIIVAAFILMLACSCHASELNIMIDGENIPVEWENNESVNALKKFAPLTVKMSAYGGFEQVGSLGHNLPRSDISITTQPGDIVLYSGNQIVIFHGSNSWAYTKLGRITGKTQSELKNMLNKSGVTLEISLE